MRYQRPTNPPAIGSDAGMLVIMVLLIAGAVIGWSALPPIDLTDIGSGPGATAAAARSATPSAPRTSATPRATARITPRPTIGRVVTAMDLLADPAPWFASEVTKDLCAGAAVQMVAAIVLGTPETDPERQRQIHAREVAATTFADSHDGGVGPEGMATVLTELAGQPFAVSIQPTRQDALRLAARTISQGAPVILLTWKGAHAWVMTGFRADADPVAFPDATITAATILDPWYPRVSSIWGPSDPPGNVEDASELIRNYLPWQRPEGAYPRRDGQFLLIVPAALA